MSKQTVITAAQAREITLGRTPLVPVEYETACKALEACRTLDEAKYWDNKADALAAWAKIHRDQKIERGARALKLHAYRRMGELAAIIRPQKRIDGRLQNGPKSLLQEHGLSRSRASAARKLSILPRNEFQRIASQPRPPSPEAVRATRKSAPGEFAFLYRSLMDFRSKTRRFPARQAANAMELSTETLRPLCKEVIEWLDEFERCLPEEKRK